MQTRKVSFLPTMVAVALTLAGCAAMQEEKANKTEQALAAAGFQMKLADTPAKLAHLQTLTQDKLVPHQQDGEMRYVYADATDCKCLYAGDAADYQAYQKLAVQERVAEDQQMAAEMNENAEMDWGMWGWGGGFRR
jgi:hypothetical protein